MSRQDPGSTIWFTLSIDGESLGYFNGCEGLSSQVEVEQRLRPLARPALGLGNGQAVEPSAGNEPAAASRNVDGTGARCEKERARADRRQRVEARESPPYTRRMDERALQEDLDRQIAATHRRFVKAMESRLPAMGLETKERYFAVLSSLVAKLETAEKPMREVMQEMMSEAAALILHEMQR